MAATDPRCYTEVVKDPTRTTDGSTGFAGTVSVTQDGFGLLVMETQVPPPRYESFILTVQSPGSEIPADRIVLAWNR